ncbi:putative acyltransferase [Hyella patelloides LEGE 07179]|uniref:Putative acyltransferase n=1 Tax=Hyella patelloides LEGE 07179 TaxID=945734 RepID=A0A563W428_9CYAN|nr:GNAT family N-acetyltransferase [Hyella patelloides]VEP18415.1 putative acyltransferase [Hyella patelloides LEGE 07179]
MLETTNYQLKFVEYGSPEYQQAAQLRYRLFYQEHCIKFESIFEPQEKQNLHLVITANPEHKVLAYGRLDRKSADLFQICQMVVEPKHQRQGLGKLILKELTKVAIQQGASLVVLNARVAKVQFYQKYGFEPIGEVFASSSTGVPHIKMQQKISQ